MPYIVKVYEPGGCLDPIGAGQEPDHTRAVATLEKVYPVATDIVRDACLGRPHQRRKFLDDAARIPESGGTVGPLPDGTIIEVERVA